jgi:hypothetical protein
MIKVRMNTTSHHTIAILTYIHTYFMKLSLASGNLSQHVSAEHGLPWIPFLQFFHHERFSVLLRKGKDWYALFIFIFQLMYNIFFFFFTEHAVPLWICVVLARRFLCQCWPLSMTKRDFHQCLLHPYLRDVRSSSFTALYELLHNLSFFIDELDPFSVR